MASKIQQNSSSSSSNTKFSSNDFQMGELKLEEETTEKPAKKKRKQVSLYRTIHVDIVLFQKE